MPALLKTNGVESALPLNYMISIINVLRHFSCIESNKRLTFDHFFSTASTFVFWTCFILGGFTIGNNVVFKDGLDLSDANASIYCSNS